MQVWRILTKPTAREAPKMLPSGSASPTPHTMLSFLGIALSLGSAIFGMFL